jgi:hypothetical protein
VSADHTFPVESVYAGPPAFTRMGVKLVTGVTVTDVVTEPLSVAVTVTV